MLRQSIRLIRFRFQNFFYRLFKFILILAFFIPYFLLSMLVNLFNYLRGKIANLYYEIKSTNGPKKAGLITLYIVLFPVTLVVYLLLVVILACYLFVFSIINICELRRAYSEIK